jgi:hypothetical protein
MLKFRTATICGSQQFYAQMLSVAKNLTAQGYIVLMPFIGRDDRIDDMQFARVDISDAILVLNTHGYIDINTKRLIAYASYHHKSVYYLYPALISRGISHINTVDTENVQTVVLEKDWTKKRGK